ncbi:lactate utilization protein [Candidatus Woesearchaeota archaeon]|nr:lactate utilization protein [Candidatus Woesearchaeota archaeon]
MEYEKWNKLPDKKVIQETINALQASGPVVYLVNDKKAALEKIKEMIPKGSEVMTGSSTTLNEIGFTDFLKSKEHGWKNLHEEILNEKDQSRQIDLRRKATTAEYFLGSLNAISKNGELVACDASGSRVGAYHFAAKHLILVAGVQKITNSLEEAMQRVREYAFPLENERAKKAYGMPSSISKWVILEKEIFPKRITLILVNEKLGF